MAENYPNLDNTQTQEKNIIEGGCQGDGKPFNRIPDLCEGNVIELTQSYSDIKKRLDHRRWKIEKILFKKKKGETGIEMTEINGISCIDIEAELKKTKAITKCLKLDRRIFDLVTSGNMSSIEKYAYDDIHVELLELESAVRIRRGGYQGF